MTQHPNLNYLRTFVMVAAEESMSLAAKRMQIAQPAVSRQMRLLEEEMGTPLLERGHDGIRLTAAGHRLRNQVEPWLQELRILKGELQGQGGPELLRFGTFTEAGQAYFMTRLLRFAAERRGLDLQITYEKEHALLHAFDNGDLDCLVVTGKAKGTGRISEAIFQERNVLVCGSHHQLAINSTIEFRHSAFVAYRADDPLLTAYCLKHYPTIKVEDLHRKVVVNSHRSMVDALLAFNLVAVMPWHSVEALVNSNTLRIASKRDLTQNLFLVTKAGWFTTELCQGLIASLRARRA